MTLEELKAIPTPENIQAYIDQEVLPLLNQPFKKPVDAKIQEVLQQLIDAGILSTENLIPEGATMH